MRTLLISMLFCAAAHAAPDLWLPPNLTDPLLQSQPAGTLDDQTYWQIDPAIGAANTAPFGAHYEQSNVFAGEPDPLLRIGYNCWGQVAGQPRLCHVIESNYAHLTPLVHDVEFYTEYTTESGQKWRPQFCFHSKGTGIGGETCVYAMETLSLEGTRPAPMTLRFRPINKGQFANIVVNGSGTSNGSDAGIHYLGAKDIGSGSSLTLSGNTSTSGEGAKAAAILSVPFVATCAAGTTECAATIKTSGTERLRVTPAGNVVINQPGFVGAAPLDVGGTALVTALALRSSGAAPSIVFATLAGGMATISDTRVTAATLITCARKTDGGIVGDSYSTIPVIGSGFGIQAMSAGAPATGDASVVGCVLIDAVP